MKRLFQLTLFSAAVLLAVSSSPMAEAASPVTYTNTFSFALSPGSQLVSLPQWDASLFPGQQLTGVEVRIDNITISALITAENDSGIGGSMGVNLTGFGTASFGALSAIAGVSGSAGPVTVSPSDGVPGSGPDFVNFGTVTGSGGPTFNSTVNPLNFAPFVGAGNFNMNVSASGGFSVSGVSNSTIHVTGFGASGTVDVSYSYAPTPEPGSVVLLGIGLVALVGYGRSRRRVA